MYVPLMYKQRFKYSELYEALNYNFRNIDLLTEALTHHSAIEDPPQKNAAKQDYQKLEFLGDRVLNFFVTQILLQRFSNISSGELNNFKIECVSNRGLLLQMAKSINLQNYLIKGKGVTEVTDKMYADAMEALLGAIYSDSNNNDSILSKLVEQLLSPYLPHLETQFISSLLEKNLSINSQISTRRQRQVASIVQRGATHFDDGVFQFRKIVLNWEFEDLEKPLLKIKDMTPLSACFSEYSDFNRFQYYSNFKDLVLEEARATLQNGLETVKAGKSSPFTLKVIQFKVARKPQNPSVFVMEGRLPKDFEHGTSNIGLLLEPITERNDSELKLLALASYQETESRENKIEVKVVNPCGRQGAEQQFFQQKALWRAYVLGSLITHQRIYDICNKMPRTNFESQIILGKLNTQTETLSLNPEDQECLLDLNSSQREAATKFLTVDSGLQLLQGPPGTGKTTTIIVILESLYKSQARILVCAPSNKAVQLLAYRFLQRNPEAAICLSGVTSKVPPELHGIFLHSLGKNIYRSIGDCIDLLNKLLAEKKLTQQKLHSDIHHIDTILSKVAHDIAKTAPAYDNPDKWKPIFTCAKLIVSLEINQVEEIQKYLKLMSQHLSNLQATMVMANQSKEAGKTSPLEMEILNHAQIVFATLSTAGRKSIQEMSKIDVLIIDEASQAIEAETLIPFALDPKKCLLVGDTKQLPAIVLSQPAVELRFYWSLMWRLIEECKQEYSMLKIQYRMHPEIRQWPSQQYYGNQLEDAENITKRADLVAFNYPPIIAPCSFINVKANEIECGHSYRNEQEARHIMAILYYLKQKGVNIKDQVGVITFYAEQVKYLSELIQPNPAYQGMTIHTVDGFQGDERDFIIISFVRANPKGRIGFLMDFRRLNVAITRAKLALIMLGNVATLRRKKSDVSLLIDDMERRNLLWPENELFQTLKTINNPRYKTRLCRNFFSGNCQHGDRCQFAHGKDELRKFTINNTLKYATFPETKQPLSQALNYCFRNHDLLREALTRQSAVEEKLYEAAPHSYQKLMFLGDHALKLAIAILLVKEKSLSNEGQLHSAEMRLISTECLSTIAKQINLEQHLIKGLGETEITDNMYADAVKAIFGAISLDSNNNTNMLVTIISKLFRPYLQNIFTSHSLTSPQAFFSCSTNTETTEPPSEPIKDLSIKY
ncbi:MAG: hypothetical protein AMJ43_05020 [Coxiella sp. DG_40]|nr:MAG: hypothetical protein AMJ43_05020 [Coxiella sp. DG_40]